MEIDKAAPKLERKIVEKNRRDHMKLLLSNLDSLLPNYSPNTKEVVTMPERLDEAVKYIKELQMRVERMKENREGLGCYEGTSQQKNLKMGVEVQDMGSGLSVFLLSFSGGFSAYSKVLRVLEEEGLEILAANFVSGEVAFIIVHCLVAENSGFEADEVMERLKKVVQGYTRN
ncbi:transcription factor bHLH162-like isoform X1 [Dioscorea cayenensis subsp. rotundata]|uniref:Transcription factor bHLH162-like isoform X1 n=1 Tax=Dioscorea cayennensis subsp. rotundata TaxID=55577 RepID=A0AB40CV53_DIOCR|nr:transcription factor bHLH162-like isoform X1 [Dioscorea cayenensis subsp. rotundata]